MYYKCFNGERNRKIFHNRSLILSIRLTIFSNVITYRCFYFYYHIFSLLLRYYHNIFFFNRFSTFSYHITFLYFIIISLGFLITERNNCLFSIVQLTINFLTIIFPLTRFWLYKIIRYLINTMCFKCYVYIIQFTLFNFHRCEDFCK